MQLHPQPQDAVDLHFDDFARKAEVRDTQVQHPAGNRRRFEDLDRVAQQRQVVRACQTADAGSHDGHALFASQGVGQALVRGIMPHPEVVPVGDVPLERADRDWLVDPAAAAGILARMGANAAQHIGEGIGGAGQEIGFLVPLQPHGLHVSAALGVDRTRRTARNVAVEIIPVRNDDAIAHDTLRYWPAWLAFSFEISSSLSAGKNALGFLSFRSVSS